ncbi:hypothetical protein Y032_0013g1964 [Ancylostoma ceylanicum]|uniref:Thioredoxin domain-containing protein n=1 Tax=Ancylostoma ceylanicum TaxID=53326 RepID=A0A016VC28_9BILA|nr:hypothetical protein Y032_0013g1964 [Ancylostoma ceylanicum]
MVLLPSFIIEKQARQTHASGFPSVIDWVEWDQAIGVAKDLNKPIFFLIHKTWCGACKGLKREFGNSPQTKELIELSKNFVMVNVEDDDEPEDEKYAPDGGYIPRIMFLDTDAEPMETNNEAKYKNHKFFYPLVPQIVDGMKRALEEFKALPKAGKKVKKGKKEDAKEKDKKKDEEEKKEKEKATKEAKSKDEKKKDTKEKESKKKDTKEKDKKKEEKSAKKDGKRKSDKDKDKVRTLAAVV